MRNTATMLKIEMSSSLTQDA